MGTDLAELLERVKAATGPDREIDGKIEVAARRIEAARAGLAPEHRARWESDVTGWVRDPHTIYPSQPVTASLDAALALVERALPRWSGWKVERTDNCWARVYTSEGGWSGIAATPPLAVIAALLSALIAEQPADVGSDNPRG